MADSSNRVVIQLLADVADLDSKVSASASKFDNNMSKIQQSGAKAEAAIRRQTDAAVDGSARIANAQRNLGRQIADIGTQLSGGQSAFLIIAQQAPQVADALADTGGAAARVASFFAGPWGAALLGAATVAGVFAGKLLESGDAADTAAGKYDSAATAAKRYADAIKLLQSLNKGEQGQQIAGAIGEANNKIATLDRDIARAEAKLQQAQANVARTYGQRALANTNLGGVNRLQAQLDRLRAQRGEADSASFSGRQKLAVDSRRADVDLAEKRAQASVDKASAANLKYADAVGAARAAYVAGKISQDTLNKRLNAAAATQKKEVDAAQAAERASRKKGPSAETLAKRAEAARVRDVRNDEAYSNQLSDLNAQILRARQTMAGSAAEQAQIEEELARERAHKIAEQIEADRSAGRYDGEQAKTLRVVNALNLNQQLAAIKAAKDDRENREQSGLKINDLQDQRELLRSQGDLAKSSAERRDIALRLVDLDIQIEQAKIDELRKSQSLADQQDGARRQGLLDQRRSIATEAARRDNMSPGQRYADSLNLNPGQMADQFEQFGVNSLERFNSELDDSVKKALHLHGILGDIVGDLIDMAIKQALIRPLANALFGGGTGAAGGFGSLFGGGGGGGGFLGGLFKTVGGFLGIGGSKMAGPSIGLGNTGFAATDFSGIGSLFGLASGGPAAPHSIHRVNEHAGGVELLKMGPNGGTVIPLGAQRAASPSSSTVVHQTINVDGRNSVTPADFASQIIGYANSYADQRAGQAYQGAIKGAPAAVKRNEQLGTT